MNDNWHDRADELHSSGMRNCDIYRQLCSEGYEVSKAAIKMRFYRQRKKAKQTDISVDDEGHINKLNQIMIPYYSSVMR